MLHGITRRDRHWRCRLAAVITMIGCAAGACIVTDTRFQERRHGGEAQSTETDAGRGSGGSTSGPDRGTSSSTRGASESAGIATFGDGRSSEHQSDSLGSENTGGLEGPSAGSTQASATENGSQENSAGADGSEESDSSTITGDNGSTGPDTEAESTAELGSTTTSSTAESDADTNSLGEEGRVVVHNRDPARVIPAGYALALEFDHAALVAAGAAADGSDLTIRYGISDRGIVRMLDPGSAWNRSDTRIWFAAQADIAAGLSLPANYRLRVDPAVDDANIRYTRPDEIFRFHEDFSHDTIAGGAWTETGSPALEWRIVGGELVGTATSDNGVSRNGELRAASTVASASGLALEGELEVEGVDQAPGCVRLYFLTLVSDDDGNPHASAVAVDRRVGLGVWEGIAVDVELSLTEPTLDGVFVYSLRWFDERMELWQGRQMLTARTADGLRSTPGASSYHPAFKTFVGGAGCVDEVSGSIRVRWLRVRELLDPEPALSFVRSRS